MRSAVRHSTAGVQGQGLAERAVVGSVKEGFP
jgi:hypothetical protein